MPLLDSLVSLELCLLYLQSIPKFRLPLITSLATTTVQDIMISFGLFQQSPHWCPLSPPWFISSQFLTHSQNDDVKMQTDHLTLPFKASDIFTSLMDQQPCEYNGLQGLNNLIFPYVSDLIAKYLLFCLQPHLHLMFLQLALHPPTQSFGTSCFSSRQLQDLLPVLLYVFIQMSSFLITCSTPLQEHTFTPSSPLLLLALFFSLALITIFNLLYVVLIFLPPSTRM